MRALILILLCSLVLSGAAFANDANKTYSVGVGCTFTTLQDAMNHIASGHAFIHVRATYQNPNAISYHTPSAGDHPIFYIIGGYDSCDEVTDSQPPATGRSTIDGHQNGTTLFVSGNAQLYLQNLFITNGKTQSSGGGIFFQAENCDGSDTTSIAFCVLDLTNVSVANNTAGVGGGVSVSGGSLSGAASPYTTAVHFNSNTQILFNTAVSAGGGVHIEGHARLYMLNTTNTYISFNNAIQNAGDGHGGALQVLGPARADIGAVGQSMITNEALVGGAIAVQNGGVVRIFSTQSGQRVQIEDNTAHTSGGAIDVEDSSLCANGYQFDGNNGAVAAAIQANGTSEVLLENFDVVSGGCSNDLEPTTTLGAFDCTAVKKDAACTGTISGNMQTSNTASGDAIISASGLIVLDRVEMRGNHGTHQDMIGINNQSAIGTPTFAVNCLIANNTMDTGDLLDIQTSSIFNGCTIANNHIDSAGGSAIFNEIGAVAQLEILFSVLSGNGSDAGIARSLRHSDGAFIKIGAVLADNLTGLNDANETTTGLAQLTHDPFVGSAGGDYHLTPNSQAVDFSPNAPLLQIDLDGNPRGNAFLAPGSSFDVGAYELQGMAVLDGIFCDSFDSGTLVPCRPGIQ